MMKYFHKILKHPIKNLYKVEMYQPHRSLAQFNFSVDVPKRRATINNIEVYHKNQGIGSIVLRDIEEYVLKMYGVQKINLCAWQKTGNNEVLHFFKKNGYHIINENSTTYDDSITIYDLYKMEKST